MQTRWMGFVLGLAIMTGCGGEGSGSASGGPAKPRGPGATTASAKAGDSAPGSAAIADPGENYVAAATKIGCLGVESETGEGFAKEKKAILSAHAYTDDSWKAASKQLGASKGDAIAKAMEAKCPP